MSYMQEAYECLIKRLKEELKRADDRFVQDNCTISMLLDFILEKHGAKVCRDLAETIEEDGGRGVVDFVRDKIYEAGLEEE